MNIIKLFNYTGKLILFFLSIQLFTSCTSILESVMDDNAFESGEYLFVMYKPHENIISVYGEMKISRSYNDSIVDWNYSTIINKIPEVISDKGRIQGTANWSKGEARGNVWGSNNRDIYITFSKTLNLIRGTWHTGIPEGKIFLFKK